MQELGDRRQKSVDGPDIAAKLFKGSDNVDPAGNDWSAALAVPGAITPPRINPAAMAPATRVRRERPAREAPLARKAGPGLAQHIEVTSRFTEDAVMVLLLFHWSRINIDP